MPRRIGIDGVEQFVLAAVFCDSTATDDVNIIQDIDVIWRGRGRGGYSWLNNDDIIVVLWRDACEVAVVDCRCLFS